MTVDIPAPIMDLTVDGKVDDVPEIQQHGGLSQWFEFKRCRVVCSGLGHLVKVRRYGLGDGGWGNGGLGDAEWRSTALCAFRRRIYKGSLWDPHQIPANRQRIKGTDGTRYMMTIRRLIVQGSDGTRGINAISPVRSSHVQYPAVHHPASFLHSDSTPNSRYLHAGIPVGAETIETINKHLR